MKGAPLAGVVLSALLVVPLPGQEGPAAVPTGSLVEADVNVVLPSPGGTARVELTYRLVPDEGSGAVPVSLLAPDPAILLLLRVSRGPDDPGRTLDLEGIRDFYSEGEISLPESDRSPGDTLSITLTYAVQGAWERVDRAVVPLVVPAWVPERATPRTFEATIEPPAGYVITSTFPTALREPDPRATAGSTSLSLQSVPAFLVIRTADSAEAGLSLEQWLDFLVLGLLLAMATVGFLYLRRGLR